MTLLFFVLFGHFHHLPIDAPPWQAALLSSTCLIGAVHSDGGSVYKDPFA
jgi:hypothetical protein